ncbi:hypothetical protein DFJ77DRAFT_466228 [Powellomyces hirtus]|nr:hypothetical protein DFJ77DRAFT_466228 [Powellomyces hirtus]
MVPASSLPPFDGDRRRISTSTLESPNNPLRIASAVHNPWVYRSEYKSQFTWKIPPRCIPSTHSDAIQVPDLGGDGVPAAYHTPPHPHYTPTSRGPATHSNAVQVPPVDCGAASDPPPPPTTITPTTPPTRLYPSAGYAYDPPSYIPSGFSHPECRAAGMPSRGGQWATRGARMDPLYFPTGARADPGAGGAADYRTSPLRHAAAPPPSPPPLQPWTSPQRSDWFSRNGYEAARNDVGTTAQGWGPAATLAPAVTTTTTTTATAAAAAMSRPTSPLRPTVSFRDPVVVAPSTAAPLPPPHPVPPPAATIPTPPTYHVGYEYRDPADYIHPTSAPPPPPPPTTTTHYINTHPVPPTTTPPHPYPHQQPTNATYNTYPAPAGSDPTTAALRTYMAAARSARDPRMYQTEYTRAFADWTPTRTRGGG